ncbi:unnamed protein product [Oncorhynchus mykiss]|uniref:Claudin n=1 Tax=Oncorhynchus mykiss TaxID=8022 RepID=A0A060YFI2_ONCMY|nr:unnamed protein product [Oncorhynchus mykiss]
MCGSLSNGAKAHPRMEGARLALYITVFCFRGHTLGVLFGGEEGDPYRTGNDGIFGAADFPVLGWVGNIICILPMWKVSAFIGNNIVLAQTIWEALWMTCVVQSTGRIQCKVYDSPLSLPPDLQAARAMVIAILLALFGLLLSVVIGKCTTCVGDQSAKARVAITAGVFFLVAGALYNSRLTEERAGRVPVLRGTSVPLLIGGALLCCQCPSRGDLYNGAKYIAPKSSASGIESL